MTHFSSLIERCEIFKILLSIFLIILPNFYWKKYIFENLSRKFTNLIKNWTETLKVKYPAEKNNCVEALSLLENDDDDNNDSCSEIQVSCDVKHTEKFEDSLEILADSAHFTEILKNDEEVDGLDDHSESNKLNKKPTNFIVSALTSKLVTEQSIENLSKKLRQKLGFIKVQLSRIMVENGYVILLKVCAKVLNVLVPGCKE